MSGSFGNRQSDAVTWSDVRRKLETLFTRMIMEQSGDSGFTTEPVWEGSTSTRQVPPPAKMMRLAVMAQTAAHAIVATTAAAMRGQGTPWRDIFPLLDIEDPTGHSPGEAAFRYVAGPGNPDYPHDPIYVNWTCATCKARVSDSGPYNGHPEDNERGHAQGCARHTSEIVAFLQETDD